MRKTLFIACMALISITCSAQRLLGFTKTLSQFNEWSFKAKVYNDSRKAVKSIVWSIKYYDPRPLAPARYNTKITPVYIPSGYTQFVTFTPPTDRYDFEPGGLAIQRVIYSDGTYKDY